MKRDLDLCRDLMLAFEAVPAGQGTSTISLKTEHDAVTVLSHIKLLIDAQLLEGYCRPIPNNATGGVFQVKDLTWSGHDFVGKAKDETVWGNAKALLKKAGVWSFELLLEALKHEASQQLGKLLT